MKNIDRLRKMGVEELAEYLNCKCCDNYKNGVPCKGAICNDNVKIFWLNQESNPMPELQVGDLIVTVDDTVYVVIGTYPSANYLLAKPDTRNRTVFSEIKKDIVRIYTYNSNSTYEVIWEDKDG